MSNKEKYQHVLVTQTLKLPAHQDMDIFNAQITFPVNSAHTPILTNLFPHFLPSFYSTSVCFQQRVAWSVG